MTKHTPGLELDRLIAEKVLGWYQESDMGGPRAWWFSPDRPEKSRILPYFSEEIEAAWLLAERFRLIILPRGKDEWSAIKSGTTNRVMAERTSKYVAHAICLAALAEVESDDR